MINKNFVYKCCTQDPSLIENYYKAISDTTQTWCCHHRREISENKSEKQLKAEGLYFQRPAEELMFLTRSDHMSLHKKGRHPSAETRAKMSAALKGKHLSAETRAKMSAAHKRNNLSPKYRAKMSANSAWKGKHRSEETRAKMSAAQKGRRWHLENGKRVYTE